MEDETAVRDLEEYDFPTEMPFAVPPDNLTLDQPTEDLYPTEGVLKYRIGLQDDGFLNQFDVVIPGWGDHLPLFWSADSFNHTTPETWEDKSTNEVANKLLFYRDNKYGESKFDYFVQTDDESSEYLVQALEATENEIESQHPGRVKWLTEVRDYRSDVREFFG